MLRYFTAGESHGKALVAILEGMPAGLKVSKALVNGELRNRQTGYGRGDRMKIEADTVNILSGLRGNETIGSPIALMIKNKDSRIDELPKVHSPRPGHADLAGAMKYGRRDMRDILERSSARETAARVAVGAVCKQFLSKFGIEIFSHVVLLGGIEAHTSSLEFGEIVKNASASLLRCADNAAEKLMRDEIDSASSEGDTLGGIFEVIIRGLPPGLGSHVQWDRKIDARLAMAIMSIQAVKGVEIGAGFAVAKKRGSKVHDSIIYKDGKFNRSTNNAGGVEGGITNGEPVIARGAMKPISTLRRPLESVDIVTKKTTKAAVERADVCAVPACAVIAENVCAVETANAFMEKFGSDSVSEIKRNHSNYLRSLAKF